jgi:hypothetical protein
MNLNLAKDERFLLPKGAVIRTHHDGRCWEWTVVGAPVNILNHGSKVKAPGKGRMVLTRVSKRRG